MGAPCSSGSGAAGECNQCFKANRAKVFGQEGLILHTETNILRLIWRALALVEDPQSWVSSPIPPAKTTEYAHDSGQSV